MSFPRTSPLLGLVDYGSGNLRSVQRAIEHSGGDCVLVHSQADAESCDALVVPGVGSFGDCARQLHEVGLWDFLRQWLAADRPYLGICLGYQLLFEASEESPGVEGLGALKGKVVHFPRGGELNPKTAIDQGDLPKSTGREEALSALTVSKDTPSHLKSSYRPASFDISSLPNTAFGLKIPHMGWNQLHLRTPSDRLVQGLGESPDFYFVHSYYPVPEEQEIVTTTCNYGVEFASSVTRGNLSAVQFHPEKSQELGLSMLRNFINSLVPNTLHAPLSRN